MKWTTKPDGKRRREAKAQTLGQALHKGVKILDEIDTFIYLWTPPNPAYPEPNWLCES